MNLAQVARILSSFVLFLSVFELIPLGFALYEPRHPEIDSVMGFAASIGIGLLVAALLWIGGLGAGRGDFFRREGLTAVALAWLIASGLGAVPFLWSGAVPTAADAIFETVSGFTTTGASVFGVGPPYYNVEDLPKSILLWRALLHFLGGLGIVLMFLVALPAMGVVGKNLLQSEQTGVAAERFTPRMRELGRDLLRVYLSLITLLTLALWTFGMPLFDSFCHTAAAIGTGGFSTKNYSIGQYQSLPIELAITVGSFCSATNYLLLKEVAQSRFLSFKALLRDAEFRFFALHWATIVLAVAVLLRCWGRRVVDPTPLSVVHDYSDFGRCLRDALFNVTTVHSSTGFANADTQNWPLPCAILLMWCMFAGGCTGSTAGGVKALRIMLIGKLVAHGFRHFLRPRSVERIRVGNDTISPATISAVLALALAWAMSILLGTLLLALDPRLDLLSALSVNATCIGGDGPGISAVRELPNGTFEVANAGKLNVGAYGGFGQLYGWQKLVLAAQMLIGRLELYPLLALLAPGSWKK